MGAFDGDTLADRFRNHFGHTDHLYGALLAGMADDWEVGGVTREIFDGWEDAPARQFPQLRMLAGLFRIVLRGDAPQLEGFYPGPRRRPRPPRGLGGGAPGAGRPRRGAARVAARGAADQRAGPHRGAARRARRGRAPHRAASGAAARAGRVGGSRPARRPLPLRRRRLVGRARRPRRWSSRGAVPPGSCPSRSRSSTGGGATWPRSTRPPTRARPT